MQLATTSTDSRAIDVLKRFESNVAPEALSGCWNWTGKPNNGGYGRMTNEEGRVMLAHRWAFRHFVSENLPPVVMHKCDNPACVNPDHLEGGTQAKNILDMWHKGRGVARKHTREQSPLTRYSREQLQAVQELRDSGLTQTKIASITGISQSHVSRILNGAVK
jgi:hypothetical protein